MTNAVKAKDSELSHMSRLISKEVSLQVQAIKIGGIGVKAGALGRILGFASSFSTSRLAV